MREITLNQASPGRALVKIVKRADSIGLDQSFWDVNGRMLEIMKHGELGLYSHQGEHGIDGPTVSAIWVDSDGYPQQWSVQEECCTIFSLEDEDLVEKSGITVATARDAIYALADSDDPKAKEAMEILLRGTE